MAGQTPAGIAPLAEFVRALLRHHSSRFTQSYRINYYTHETLQEEPALYNATPAVPAAGKPPKDIQVLLGYVPDKKTADAYKSALTFFCHAVDWTDAKQHACDGLGKPGAPTGLKFDPFKSDQFVAYQANRTFPWVAEVEEVHLVTAAERATE